MSRSCGPGVGVGRGETSRTPAAFVGRMAARCWGEVVEDILSGWEGCGLSVWIGRLFWGIGMSKAGLSASESFIDRLGPAELYVVLGV